MSVILQQRSGWKNGLPTYIATGSKWYSRMEKLEPIHENWNVLRDIITRVSDTYLLTTIYQEEHFVIPFSREKRDYLIGLHYKF